MALNKTKPCKNLVCREIVCNGNYCDKCRKKNTKVYLVVGPSGSGKSTLVRNRARPDDLVIDLDLIFHAISNCALYKKPASLLPFALAAREKMISMIGDFEGVPNVWIIRNKITASEISAFQKQLDAELIMLMVPAEECKRRIDQDQSRPREQLNQWYQRIDEWYQDHP